MAQAEKEAHAGLVMELQGHSEDRLLQKKEMVLTVAWGLRLDAGRGSPRARWPQLLVAETGHLKPLDCPGDSNDHG